MSLQLNQRTTKPGYIWSLEKFLHVTGEILLSWFCLLSKHIIRWRHYTTASRSHFNVTTIFLYCYKLPRNICLIAYHADRIIRWTELFTRPVVLTFKFSIIFFSTNPQRCHRYRVIICVYKHRCFDRCHIGPHVKATDIPGQRGLNVGVLIAVDIWIELIRTNIDWLFGQCGNH